MIKQEPLVSVWMTTYNHERYIAEAIKSVVMQKTKFKFELVIGEDCSTDNTAKICREYAQMYPDIIKLFVREKNLGMMENGFQTFSQTKGKYIACLEGDDYWIDDNKLQMQVDALENDKNAVICFTKVKFWDEISQEYVENTALNFIDKSRFSFFDILKLNVISTGSVLFENKFNSMLPQEIYLFPIGDWLIYLFLMLNGNEAIYLNKVTTVYRKHDGGIYSQTSQLSRILLNISIYEKLLTLPQFQKYKSQIKKEISEKSYNVARIESKKDKPDSYLVKNGFRKTINNFNLTNIEIPLRGVVAAILFSLNIKV